LSGGRQARVPVNHRVPRIVPLAERRLSPAATSSDRRPSPVPPPADHRGAGACEESARQVEGRLSARCAANWRVSPRLPDNREPRPTKESSWKRATGKRASR
jgi:hypothetical protein